MKAFKNRIRAMWSDESAQGATEYILLVVVIVGLVIVFKDPITNAIRSKVESLSSKIGSVE